MPTFGLSVRLQSKGGYELKCGKMDLNDVEGPHRLVQALTQIIADPTVWNRLEVHRELYFQTPDGSLPTEPGWYVVRDSQRTPLFVGQADNLDYRLNSTNGTLDNFANSQRKHDSARNFIKALRTMGYLSALYVAVVRDGESKLQAGQKGFANHPQTLP
jgi:hypothetical protein